MFRCSDHDPVLIGLRLDSTAVFAPETEEVTVEIRYENAMPCIHNAEGGFYYVYSIDGSIISQSAIATNEETLYGLKQGLYIINIYAHGICLQSKIIIQ